MAALHSSTFPYDQQCEGQSKCQTAPRRKLLTSWKKQYGRHPRETDAARMWALARFSGGHDKAGGQSRGDYLAPGNSGADVRKN
jgi:hypothetical protein